VKRLIRIWRIVRRLSGDDAYERYLEHHRAAHAGVAPLDEREFWIERQGRKWSGVQRCC
jgi:uncharacterized short protein YbdD (DUF466 family)